VSLFLVELPTPFLFTHPLSVLKMGIENYDLSSVRFLLNAIDVSGLTPAFSATCFPSLP